MYTGYANREKWSNEAPTADQEVTHHAEDMRNYDNREQLTNTLQGMQPDWDIDVRTDQRPGSADPHFTRITTEEGEGH